MWEPDVKFVTDVVVTFEPAKLLSTMNVYGLEPPTTGENVTTP